jgi:RNA polymerase sigma factor (sigma-70 family)
MEPELPPVRAVLAAEFEFEAFYRAEYRGALALSLLLCSRGARDEAEDLVQEAFRRVYGHLASVERPDAYLRTTLVNLARTQYRTARRRSEALARLTPVHESPADSTLAHELWELVDALPFRERVVVVLRYHDDLPDDDIAEALHCRPATVRTIAARAMRRLRGALQ